MQTTIARLPRATVGSNVALQTAILTLYTGCCLLMSLGAGWDVQWHTVVGRDTFWIPPHVLIYGGVAFSGLLAAAAVLLAGLPWGSHARPWPWGLLVGGFGVVTMLVAAPFDELWHRLYGIDVTIWSPPHMTGVVGAWVIAFGALLMWAQRFHSTPSGRTRGWALVGFALSAALLVDHTNFGLIPAVRWSFTQPHTPYLYPLLASLVLPLLMVALLRLLGRWWAPLTVLVALVGLRLLEQGVLELGYRVVVPWWGERLRGTPEGIVRNYNIALLLAAGLLLATTLVAWALERWQRGWRTNLLVGTAAGLTLWLSTLLLHIAQNTTISQIEMRDWRAETATILSLTGGAAPLTVLVLAVLFGTLGGLVAGQLDRPLTADHSSDRH